MAQGSRERVTLLSCNNSRELGVVFGDNQVFEEGKG